MANKLKTTLPLPVEVIEGDNYTVIHLHENVLGQPIVVQGDNREDAERRAISMLKFTVEYHMKRSSELDRWKPFQKGDWTNTGGKWLIIYGIHFYLRIGEGMKGGKYIPFTNWNIKFTNYWRIPIRKTTYK